MFLVYIKNKGAKYYRSTSEKLYKDKDYSTIMKKLKVTPKKIKFFSTLDGGKEGIEFTCGNKTYSIVDYRDWVLYDRK